MSSPTPGRLPPRKVVALGSVLEKHAALHDPDSPVELQPQSPAKPSPVRGTTKTKDAAAEDTSVSSPVLPMSPPGHRPQFVNASEKLLPGEVLGLREGRELFYRLRKEPLYTAQEEQFIAKRFGELAPRINKTIVPRVILACDDNKRFLANAVLLTMLGCEVEGTRDMKTALAMAAPLHRPPGYQPPDLVVIEKSGPARPVDFSLRDMCFAIRSRDATYTRDSGFISRTNVLAIAVGTVKVFDAGDSTADLILRGTLFRNLSLVRRLILPPSVHTQARLRVRRAGANYKRIEQLLVPAPAEPDKDGRVRLDDPMSQALAAQRMAGGLEEEVLYLREVIKQRDKELKKRTDECKDHVIAATEAEYRGMEREVTFKREKDAQDEEVGRLRSQLSKTMLELKGSQHQMRLMQQQFDQRSKLAKLRHTAAVAQATPTDDSELASAASYAMLKMALLPRIESMSPPSPPPKALRDARSVGIQCLRMGGSLAHAKLSNESANELSLSMPSPKLTAQSTSFSEVPYVEEVVEFASSAEAAAAAQRQIGELRKQLAAADERARAAAAQTTTLQARLAMASMEGRESAARMEGAQDETSKQAFDLGRLEEVVRITREDKDALEKARSALEGRVQELEETKALLESRLRDDDTLMVQRSVALHKEHQARKETDQEINVARSNRHHRTMAKEVLLRCVLLAALTKRTAEVTTLQTAIAAADSKAKELKAMVRQERKAAESGSAPDSTAKPKKAKKPEAETREVATAIDAAMDLATHLSKTSAALQDAETRLQKMTAMFEDARKCITPLEKELHAAKKEVSNAAKVKAAAEESVAKAEKELALSHQEADHYKTMFTKAKGEMSELQNQLATTARAAADLRAQNDAKAQLIEHGERDKQAAVAGEKLVREQLTAALNQLRDQQTHQNADGSSAKETMRLLQAAAQREVDDERRNTLEAERRCVEAKGEAADLKRKNKELKMQVGNLRAQVANLAADDVVAAASSTAVPPSNAASPDGKPRRVSIAAPLIGMPPTPSDPATADSGEFACDRARRGQADSSPTSTRADTAGDGCPSTEAAFAGPHRSEPHQHVGRCPGAS
jgi:hypothetical protein